MNIYVMACMAFGNSYWAIADRVQGCYAHVPSVGWLRIRHNDVMLDCRTPWGIAE